MMPRVLDVPPHAAPTRRGDDRLPPVPDFADLLRAAPTTVRETASRAGTTVAMLYRYRDGAATPRCRRRAQLARALLVTVAELDLALERSRLQRRP